MDNFDLIESFIKFSEEYGELFETEEEMFEAFKAYIEMGAPLDDMEETDEDRSMKLYHESHLARTPEERTEILRQALEMDPDNFFAELDLILLSNSPSGLREELLNLYSKVKTLWEDNTEQMGWYNLEERPYLISIYSIAETLFKMNLLKDAEKLLMELMEWTEHDNLGARYYLMKIYAHTHNFDQAMALFESNDYYTNDDQMVFLMLVMSVLSGNQEEALELFNKYEELNPEAVDFFRNEEFDIISLSKYFGLSQIRLQSMDSLGAVVEDLAPLFLHSDFLYDWLHEYAGDEELIADGFEFHFSELLEQLPPNKRRILYLNDLITVDDFKNITIKELLSIKGIGPKTVKTLIELGVEFKEE